MDRSEIDRMHLAEPGLVVLTLAGADEETVLAAAAELERWWATSGTPKVRRVPGARLPGCIAPPPPTSQPWPASSSACRSSRTEKQARPGKRSAGLTS
ncbi:DUF6207 family protein [Streptomyces sp. NPDC086023]|uniref:DUF6207 family protein n=1 Tax=Streptomyces sp. NPDC086023 TaxID=3365746 RepID=UPI0037CDDA75